MLHNLSALAPMKTKNTVIPVSPFRAELARNIAQYIRAARADGVTGMSADNLRRCVKTPSPYMEGAPRGTNAQWVYGEIFREVLATVREARGFVLA